jgi:hypothetical protein
MDNLNGSDFENEEARREAAPDILHRLYHMLIDRCEEASEWYMQRKDEDRMWSRRLRILAIALSTVALLIPVLISIGQDSTQSNTSEQISEAARVAVNELMVRQSIEARPSNPTSEDTSGNGANTSADEADAGGSGNGTSGNGTSGNGGAAENESSGGGEYQAAMRFLAGLSQVWALFLAAIAAALIGLDRLMGYSTGWVRNMRAGLDLQHRREQFVLEWWALQTYYPLGGPSENDDPSEDAGKSFRAFAILDSPPTGPPVPLPEDQNDDYVRVLEKYVDALWDFDRDMRTIMEEETERWIQEFQTNLQALRSRTSRQTSRSSPSSTLDGQSSREQSDREQSDREQSGNRHQGTDNPLDQRDSELND